METHFIQNEHGVSEKTPLLSPTKNGRSAVPAESRRGSGSRAVLALQDVCYTVRYHSGPWWSACCSRQCVKQVLHDVTLPLPVGELIGVVGSSGSGKTSLLDVIAFRSQGDVTGKMTYDDQPCRKRVMRQRVSYVIQADRLLPNLTVRETLTYTARLKLAGSLSRKQIEDKVGRVIQHMGLKAVADSRVGGAVVRGISGGERRRVTIALQLLKDPDILLMDEPTTGLDSFTARHLVSSLQSLARKGKLVILTLHQPRSDITRLLDRTVMMCQGHVMYYGVTSGLVPYFTALGYPCPVFTNPLDVYMDAVSLDRRSAERHADSRARTQELLSAYRQSALLADSRREVSAHMVHGSALSGGRSSGSSSTAGPRFKPPNWFSTFATLVGRMNVNISRDRLTFFNRLALFPAYVPFALAFLGRLGHNQTSIQDRMGLLFNSVYVPPYIAIMNNVACFPSLRDHFYREGLDGLYGCQTFLLAYTVHVLPFVLLGSLFFSSFLYWATGMYPEVDRFGVHLAVAAMLHLAGELITCFSMGLFRNSQLATTVTTLFITGSCLVATGFLRSLQTMQEYLQYLSWASIHKYASEIVVANEFHLLNLTCQGLPCILHGDKFIEDNYPGAVQHMERNFEVMAAFLLAFQILAILVFKLVGLRASM